jgi:hypothetical protein
MIDQDDHGPRLEAVQNAGLGLVLLALIGLALVLGVLAVCVIIFFL